MIPRSETLADLIEPTLYALRNPSSDLLEPLVKSARNARLHAQAALRTTRRDVDLYSFELGVASAMTELLTVADQRTVISDAAKVVKSMPKGLETLHQVAFINRSGLDANQGELAKRIGTDRGNFNRRIKKLLNSGLIESQRRGQSVVYALTPLGMDLLTQLKPGWRAIHPSTHDEICTELEAARVAKEESFRIMSSIGNGIERIPAEMLIDAGLKHRHHHPLNTMRAGVVRAVLSPGRPEPSRQVFVSQVSFSSQGTQRSLEIPSDDFRDFLMDPPKRTPMQYSMLGRSHAAD